jgi:hypothetical protein
MGEGHAQVISVDNINGTFRLEDTNVDGIPLLR